MNRRHALGVEALAFGGMEHAVAHERGQGFLVEVLELAPAAAAEVTARRLGVMRPRLDDAVVPEQVAGGGKRGMAARRGDAIAFGGDADDLFSGGHSAAA